MSIKPTLGIDMAKASFTAGLRFDGKRVLKADYENSRSGFRKLHTWLKTHGAGGGIRVAVESTSTDLPSHPFFGGRFPAPRRGGRGVGEPFHLTIAAIVAARCFASS